MNLSKGVLPNCINETCTAGAGTLLLEFGVLSRLLADPVYDFYAQQAVKMLWKYRSNVTGLLGTLQEQDISLLNAFFLLVDSFSARTWVNWNNSCDTFSQSCMFCHWSCIHLVTHWRVRNCAAIVHSFPVSWDMNISTCNSVYVCARACMCVYTRVCVYTRACVCVCVCVCFQA